jgi:hypothetical protein
MFGGEYFAFAVGQIIAEIDAILFRQRGVGHRRERWGRLRWTRQRRARVVFAGRLSVSGHVAQTNGA